MGLLAMGLLAIGFRIPATIEKREYKSLFILQRIK